MKIQITNAFVLGPGQHAALGDVLDLPEKEAKRWIRVGNAKPYVPPPAKPAQAPPGAAAGEIDTQPVEVTHFDPTPAAAPVVPPASGSGRRTNR